ncbi:Prolyl 4-hydroxylase subunit alpha-1 [Folsomia candida]|uniref:Prolyl 4-hydroxylase subunit alpha-1 n=1 Tax=Folsomia candida TaxID=158441 RepID=A0A226D1I4_FOLCA|nr:Prolyl 4-hydroxylase subunit alpha-1 [Folsomia candida]
MARVGVFTSLLDTEKWADKEEMVYSMVKHWNVSSSVVPYLKEYIEDYESSTAAARGKYKVFDHLLLTYRMFYRWQHYMPTVLKEITNHDKLTFPDEFEISTTATTTVSASILTLQFFYNLPTKELIDGTFRSVTTGIGLTNQQPLQLAKEGLEMEYYVQVWDWVNVLLARGRGNNDTVLIKQAEDLERHLIAKHDEIYIRDRQLGFRKYVFVDALSNYTGVPEPLFQFQMDEFLDIWEGSKLPAERNFKHIAICSDSDAVKVNPPPLSNLRCWTDHGGHPFYVLAPRKVEKLWDSPDVYQFYDVLNLQWIEKVKILAAPVPEIGESAMDFTSIREEEFPPIGHTGLTNKLESMLGIHLGGYYRVSVYHQAGEGKVHHDSFRVPNQINEVKMFTKRLASIIIYISDPELGGETVFPEIPLKVKAVSGRNYLTEDRLSWDVWHAPCPTILGNRWFIAYFVDMERNLPLKAAYTTSNVANICTD